MKKSSLLLVMIVLLVPAAGVAYRYNTQKNSPAAHICSCVECACASCVCKGTAEHCGCIDSQ